MYLLSHRCLMNSYKAFLNLHTWVCLSCVSTSSGCKCLFVVYAFFLWEASCYESCLLSHDVAVYCMLDLVDPYGRYYRLPFRSSTSHSGHHSSFWIFRVNLELLSLDLWNKSHPSFLVDDCMWSFLQFKCISCMVRNISQGIFIIGKFLCINIWSCNYFSQYNIHPYLTETF